MIATPPGWDANPTQGYTYPRAFCQVALTVRRYRNGPDFMKLSVMLGWSKFSENFCDAGVVEIQ